MAKSAFSVSQRQKKGCSLHINGQAKTVELIVEDLDHAPMARAEPIQVIGSIRDVG